MKKFFAFIGFVCLDWIVVSELYVLVIFIASIFKTVKTGSDDLTNTAFAFFNLPVWAMIIVILLAVYSIAYIVKNYALIKKLWENFSAYMFQD